MRISDWSSDVCSSDLIWHLAQSHSGHGRGCEGVVFRPRAQGRRVQVALRGQGESPLPGRDGPPPLNRTFTRSLKWPKANAKEPRRPESRRSEAHTSELQYAQLVCRLLLEKKKTT